MKSSDSSIWLIMLLFNHHLFAILCFRHNTYGRSQLLARWPGTHSQILSGIQRAAQTVLGMYLKPLVRTLLVYPAHQALYKSMHSLTHSLTHCANCISTLLFPTTYQNILLIFIRNLFLSVLYIALSSEIVFSVLLLGTVRHSDFAFYVYYLMCVCRI